jgi:hypothetical protein
MRLKSFLKLKNKYIYIGIMIFFIQFWNLCSRLLILFAFANICCFKTIIYCFINISTGIKPNLFLPDMPEIIFLQRY